MDADACLIVGEIAGSRVYGCVALRVKIGLPSVERARTDKGLIRVSVVSTVSLGPVIESSEFIFNSPVPTVIFQRLFYLDLRLAVMDHQFSQKIHAVHFHRSFRVHDGEPIVPDSLEVGKSFENERVAEGQNICLP